MYFLLFGQQDVSESSPASRDFYTFVLHKKVTESNICRQENEKTFGVFESDDGSLLVWDHDDSVRQGPVLLKVQLQHVWKGIRNNKCCLSVEEEFSGGSDGARDYSRPAGIKESVNL